MPPSTTAPTAVPRSLLPWPSTGTSDDESSHAGTEAGDRRLSGKRVQVPAACNECRAKKVKCTAERPSCARCTKRRVSCQWDVAPEETRSLALKRKHEETVEEVARLTTTVSHYEELIELIRASPSESVNDLLRYLRMSPSRDPAAIIRCLKEGDLHTQRRFSNPATNPLMARIDAEALADSHIKVPARPWTNVAGDGMVSHLISLYFDRYQPFHLCWPDEGSFLDDMRAGDVNRAKYCSPMLVNVMCAFAAFHSPHAATVDAVLGGKLRTRFYDNARICADKDQQKASLVTTEASMLLFLYTSAAAIDRIGSVYRFAACSMYQQLRLGSISNRTLYAKDPTGIYARAVSRAAWGLFCIESAVSITFLQPSLIPLPRTPRAFLDERDGSTPAQHKPGPCDFSLDRQCSIIELVHHLWNSASAPTVAPGSIEDLKGKHKLYKSIEHILTTFPHLLFAPDRRRDYLFLKTWYHVIAITIYRPIVEQDIALPELQGTPQSVCLFHCKGVLDDFAAWRKYSDIDISRGIPSLMFPLYVVIFTLIPMLGRNPDSQLPFVQSCKYFADIAPFWPQASALLKGAAAVLKTMKVNPPREASEMMDSADWVPEPDLPIGMRIPQYSDLYETLSDPGTGPWYDGVELGELIAKCFWAIASDTNDDHGAG